ncbi:MAG: autotransporter domain-containing protein [Chlamydiales bacterium]|nr:autotransporter domain-containing protein [Chlamydiales bacterium]
MARNRIENFTLSIATLALLGITFPAETVTTSWKATPSTNDIRNGSNWSTNSPPGSSDVGRFSTSTITALQLSPTATPAFFNVGEFHFANTAPSYTFAIAGSPTTSSALRMLQAGITADVGAASQTFNSGIQAQIQFSGSSSADASGTGLITYNVTGSPTNTSTMVLENSATLGSANVNLSNRARLLIVDSSSAGSSTITANSSSLVFTDSTTASSASLNLTNGASLSFQESSSAGNATITLSGTDTKAFFLGDHSGGNSALTVNSNATVSLFSSDTFGSIAGNATGIIAFNDFLTVTVGANSNNTTFSGILNGAANFTKVGSGTWIFSPSNSSSYVGTLIIDDGILALPAVGAIGSNLDFQTNGPGIFRLDGSNAIGSIGSDASGSILFQGNTLTTGSSNANTVIAGPLTGPGNLTKVGLGRMNITSVNPGFSGAIAVNEGNLAINGSLGSSFSVGPSGTLSGSGVAFGVVNNNGKVAPGNSIGSLAVGSYVANAGSITQIEVGENLSSQIEAQNGLGAGTVTINNGAVLELTFDNGVIYNNGALYTIITAESGFTTPTHFAVAGMLPGHVFQVNYLTNEIQLLLAEFDFMEKTLSGDAKTVAGILDQLNPAFGSDLSNVMGVLQGLSGDAYADALDQMQPSALNALAIAQENNSTRVTQAISDRMLQLYETSCSGGCAPQKQWTFWGDILADFQRQDAIEDQVGFRANTGGMIAGVEYGCLNHFFVGASTAYTYTALDWKASRGDASINTLYADIYAAWFSKYAYANASLLGGYNWYGVDREIEFMDRTAESDHTGVEYDAHLEAGLLFSIKKFEIRPFDSLDYIYLHEKAFSETGARSLNLAVSSKVSNMLRNELGLGFARCFAFTKWKFVPDLKFSWIREVRYRGEKYTTRLIGTGLPFEVFGMKPNRSLFGAGAGLTTLFLEERMAATLRYNGEFQGQYSDQNVNFQLAYKF